MSALSSVVDVRQDFGFSRPLLSCPSWQNCSEHHLWSPVELSLLWGPSVLILIPCQRNMSPFKLANYTFTKWKRGMVLQLEEGLWRGIKVQNSMSIGNWEALWLALSRDNSGKESTCQRRRRKRCKFHPWIRKIPWRRKWQPTPVFLPGKSHGQRNLAGYSPWDYKELDTT